MQREGSQGHPLVLESEMRRGGGVRGTGRALRRELGAWAGIVAKKSGDERECALAGPQRARGGRN
jgi:hypothetical protein